MKRRVSKLQSAIFATSAVVAACGFSPVQAQIASLDHGHSLLINSGLQIWGLNTDSSYTYNPTNFYGANFTAVNWGYGPDGTLTTGQKWSKWTDYTGSPTTALNATEQAHQSDLVSIGVGDEQQGDMENGSQTLNWFNTAHANNLFTNQLLYVNSFFINSDAAYANFIGSANPDAISFDSYPFDNPPGAIITPTNWLAVAQHFRQHGLGSYIGATGNAPRPYGLYLQSYHGGDGARDPSDVEMRWQQFAAWTMGYTFVDAFTAGGGNTSLFMSGNGNLPNQPLYSQFQETARQSRNLGPALTHLISYSNATGGHGTDIVPGKNADGSARGVPGGWQGFSKTDAPSLQQFLTNVSAANIGTKNSGQPGDVYVGFFNPLLTSYGSVTGDTYFMATNGLGGDLADPTATVTDCKQQLTLNFDFGSTGITSLQRLNRNTGAIDIINTSFSDGGNTVFASLGGSQYQLTLKIDGGTGDLFKYNDGTRFVGIEAAPISAYWDPDGASSGNNIGTGTGMGGSGTWDTASTRWYPGTGSDAKWTAANNPIFYGSTGGTVTLASNQYASSIAFKTSGYLLSGSTLNLTGNSIATDPGVTATIASVLNGSVGLIKSGSGTLVLVNGANTYGGGTTVSAGTLSISSDGNLGLIPVNTQTSIFIGGGTLQLTGSFTINPLRGIDNGIGATIDVQGAGTVVTFAATNGFRGGDLTKAGPGTFYASPTTGGLNNLWTGNLILKQGIWEIQATDGLPINPTTGGPRPAQITFDGGTLQLAKSVGASQSNRGITVAAGGGTIDTNGFDLTWPGAVSGSVATAVLNKIGAGNLRLNTAPTASNYPGTLNVNGGTLQLNGGTAMGDLASIHLANTAGVAMQLTGANETIGSLAGGGSTGGSLNLNTFTLTTGGNGSSTTFAGTISGAGGALTKAGTGAMTLASNNTYTGATTVSAGKLIFAASHTNSSSLTVAASAVAQIAPDGTRVLKTPSVSISGQLDLDDNKLITQSPIGSLGGSTYTGITGLIQTGRNNANWNGTGVVTSMSAAQHSNFTTLGIAKGSEVTAATASSTATWAGQTVSGNDTLVMYTYGGDANLDGKINIDDYIRIDNGIASDLNGWSNGDFNYDGKVNIDDYTSFIDANIGMQGAAFPTAGGVNGSTSDVAAVPEPIVSALPMIGALALMSRRRARGGR